MKEGRDGRDDEACGADDGRSGVGIRARGAFRPLRLLHCVEIADGEITGTSEVANPPHEEGGCMRPVGLLAKAGVDAIVAAGMGMRPLTGFNQAGITVYFENQTPIVGDAAKLVAAGSVPVMSADNACNHHH